MKRTLGRLVLRLTGWRLVGEIPVAPKYVVIAAPHTSNWDFFYLLALSWSVGVDLSWLGKHTLFPPLLRGLARWLGGIPVRRDQRNDLVNQMAELFASRERLILTVPAEGTRERVEYWKSGFYHIARAAKVPIMPGFLDYPSRRGGFGPPLDPTGDVAADMDVLRAFYADKVGRHPDQQGSGKLREEEEVG